MTQKTKAELDVLFGDNTSGDIGADDARDFIDSAIGTRYVSSEDGAVTLDRDDEVVVCDGSVAGFTVTLPAASGYTHKVYTIIAKDVSSGNIVVDGDGAETIDGAATQTLDAAYESITIVCDGTEWFIIADTR